MAWQPELQGVESVERLPADQATRAFMARVYRWMFAGLALTGGVALYTASNVEWMQLVARSFWLLLIGEFGLVLVLSLAAQKLSAAAAGALFIVYAALNGLTMSGIFLAYRLGSIGEAFLVTAGAYAALSAYGTFTRRDLDAWRSFLVMGLFGVVIAGVINLFVHSAGLSFVWSCACVLVFAGLTAYDTQKLRSMHASNGYTAAASFAVVGALVLYLDFVNLFLSLLRLFGRRR